jgi:hypothetical protein
MEALGRNGSPAAIVALSDLKPQPELAFARDVALLACADRVARTADKAVAAAVYRQLFAENQAETIRCGALRGLLAGDAVHAVGMVSPVLGKESPRLQGVAADYLRESADEATVMAFARALPSMSVSGQVLLLDVFAARGATAVRFAVLRALNSREEPVRIAAVQALASLGDTGCVRTLLTLAAKQDALGQEAADALQRLGALGVDDALLAEAKKGTPERRVQCVDLLVARRARVAVPAFLAYAKADDKALVASACKGLGQLAGTDDLPALVGLLTSLDADTSRRAVAKATLAVAKRCPDEAERTAALLAALPNAPEKAQLEIIGALGELGPVPNRPTRCWPWPRRRPTPCGRSWPCAAAYGPWDCRGHQRPRRWWRSSAKPWRQPSATTSARWCWPDSGGCDTLTPWPLCAPTSTSRP